MPAVGNSIRFVSFDVSTILTSGEGLTRALLDLGSVTLGEVEALSVIDVKPSSRQAPPGILAPLSPLLSKVPLAI